MFAKQESFEELQYEKHVHRDGDDCGNEQVAETVKLCSLGEV